MPARITPNETSRPVAFTLTESDIKALTALAEIEGVNRSAWIRSRIRREAAALPVATSGACNHLPVVRDENARSWWVRLGKSNPFLRGGHCVVCWGEEAPKKVAELSNGKAVWMLHDGTEVRA